ncbi:MAG: hypothetical protein FWD92_02800 [Methanomassiliicoccaceae archaeon]|nr:hypothetical protein [Methanomassiliicoccaceae archaeon]
MIDDIDNFRDSDAQEDEEAEEQNQFNDDARNAIYDIREGLGRQLELASNKQNSMVTIIGILLAFASLMFISTYPNEGVLNGLLSGASISAIFFGACCAAGIITILLWRDQGRSSERYISQAIDYFNKEMLFEVQTELFYGLKYSYNTTREKNIFLGKVIKLMVLIITIGIIVTIFGRG